MTTLPQSIPIVNNLLIHNDLLTDYQLVLHIFRERIEARMKLFLYLILGTLILSGCSKNPSSLTCEVWEEKRVETGKVVDYWSELSGLVSSASMRNGRLGKTKMISLQSCARWIQ